MCEYCGDKRKITSGQFEVEIKGTLLNIGNECSEGCGYDWEEFSINYCPICGKKLGE
jgi:hypothetical protein